jgi:hypothetical protein
MAFIKYSDGKVKKVFSSPLSSEELAELATEKPLEKEAGYEPDSKQEKLEKKPKWAE